MGLPASEPGRGSDEGPQHEVTITQGHYLGKYDTTQAQWESVMGCAFATPFDWGRFSRDFRLPARSSGQFFPRKASMQGRGKQWTGSKTA